MESNLSPSPDITDVKPSFRKPSNDAANRKYRRHSSVSGSASSSSGGSPNHGRSPSPEFSRDDPAKISDDPRRRENVGRELEMESGFNRSGRTGDSYRNSERQSYQSSHDSRLHDDYSRYRRHADVGERSYQRPSLFGRESRHGTRFNETRRESEYERSRGYRQHANRYTRDKPDYERRSSKDKERETVVLNRQKYKDKDFSSDRVTSGRRHINSNLEEVKTGEEDRHNRDRGRDDKKDYRKNLGDYKNDHTSFFDESRGNGKDSTTGRDSGRNHLKETHKGNIKEPDGQKGDVMERRKHNNMESDRHKERNRDPDEEDYSTSTYRESYGRNELRQDKTSHVNEDNESSAKKAKLFNTDKGTDNVKGQFISKSTCVADERPPSCSKRPQEIADKVIPEPSPISANESVAAHDLNAAKVAAMKAAELVNKNLMGGSGYMSTDQKKKLLWGNKKNNAAEESGHHWDMQLFLDQERQEKFNKLMSLRWYLWPIVGCEERFETRAQNRQHRWQWPPPNGEAEGSPVGFREAVHCWTPAKRWPHSWAWSLILISSSYHALTRMSDDVFLYLYLILYESCLFDLLFPIQSHGEGYLTLEKLDSEYTGVEATPRTSQLLSSISTRPSQ